MMEKMLSVREAAEFLRRSPNTLYRWVEFGKIPCVKIHGRVLFESDKLEEFIRQGRSQPIMLPLPPPNSLDIASIDRQYLKRGGKSAVGKSKRRWRYANGTIFLRKTKSGVDRWAIDYKDGGRRVREIVRDAQTRGEAFFALQQKVAASFNNRVHPAREAEPVSFACLADTYIDDYAKVKKRSWKTDYYLVKSSMKPFFGTMTCAAIRSLDVERYVKHRLDEGVSKATANRCVQILRVMFNLAIDWGYLNDNPVRKVKLFSEKDNLKERVLTGDEELRLLDASLAHMRPIIICALHTGMRRGEILGLRWDQVDFGNGTIRVDKAKSGKPRFIPINGTLLGLLRRQQIEHPGAEFVFPSFRTGRAFFKVDKAFKRACKLASITGLRFHDLRHTFASRLIARGVDIITVKELLGHSSVRITERYTHSLSEQRRRAVGQLDAPMVSILARGWHAAAEGEKKAPANPYFSMN